MQGQIMSYRNILVQVDTKSGSKARVETAVATAARFKSSLTGLFLKSATIPSHVIGSGATALPAEAVQRIGDERAQKSAEKALAAKALFDKAAANLEGAADWMEFDGDKDDDIIACSRQYDLNIFPRVAAVEHSSNTIEAEQIGMGSGGPVLVLPAGGYSPNLGRKILFAWNGSRESARALRDAWPFLREADEVHFVVVSQTAKKTLSDGMKRNLAAHNVKSVKLIVDRDDDGTTGEIIRRHVDLIGADMMVLGLYGHARVTEFVLGGVSRDILTALPTPLLISH
jgi:nucleotide-binding universal stress UspA family protein